MKRKLWISVLLCLFLAASVLFLCACERPEKTGTEKPGTEEPGTEEPDEGNEDDENPDVSPYNVLVTYEYGTEQLWKKEISIPKGSCAPVLPVPTRTGYAFTHWEDTFGNKWDFSKPVNRSMVLYAVWIEAVDLTISFDWDDGSLADIQTKSSEIVPLPDLARNGYSFQGYDCVSAQGEVFIERKEIYSYVVPFCSDAVLTPVFLPAWSFEPTRDGTEYRIDHYTEGGKIIQTNVEYMSLPSEYNGKPVTEIADEAFAKNESLRTVIIPASYRSIGAGSFSLCSRLEEVVFETGLQEIGDSAFSDCAMTSLTLPDSLVSIGSYAFSSLPLESLTLPDSVEEIGKYIFGNQIVTVSTNRTQQAAGWTEGWNYRSVVLYKGDDMLQTGDMIFVLKPNGEASLACVTNLSLSLLEIPDTVEKNGKTYPVTKILDNVMGNMGSMDMLFLPEGLQWVGKNSLPSCEGINYREKDGLLFLGSAQNHELVLCSVPQDIKSVSVPANTRIIYQNACKSSIDSLEFAQDGELRQICSSAFSFAYCDLPANVYLPDVEIIEEKAFKGSCARLFCSGIGENWEQNWHADSYVFDLTQGQFYTDDTGEWFLQDGKASLLFLTKDRENGIFLPESVQAGEEDYVVSSILYAALWGDKMPFLHIPDCVTQLDGYKIERYINRLLLQADSVKEEWNILSQSKQFIFCGLDGNSLLAEDGALFLVKNGKASAFCCYFKYGDVYDRTYCLPRQVQGIPVDSISGFFLSSLSYSFILMPDNILYIEKSTEPITGKVIYAQATEKPDGWEEGWNFSGVAPAFPVYFGAEFPREERVTFTFVTNGTAVSPQTEYFLPTCPDTWLNYHYFWGWYENADYSGESISFPYFGTATTLYARFQMVPKEDGKLKETAFCVTENEPFRAEIRAGESIYFRLPSPRVNATYVAEMTVTADTYTELSDANYVIDETKSSAGETLSFRYTSYGGSHYLCIRLDGEAETATAEILFYRE